MLLAGVMVRNFQNKHTAFACDESMDLNDTEQTALLCKDVNYDVQRMYGDRTFVRLFKRQRNKHQPHGVNSCRWGSHYKGTQKGLLLYCRSHWLKNCSRFIVSYTKKPCVCKHPVQSVEVMSLIIQIVNKIMVYTTISCAHC